MKTGSLTQRVMAFAVTSYFFASLAFIGFCCGYLVTAPLYILARFFPSLKRPTDLAQCFFISWLMRLQPGLRVTTNLPALFRAHRAFGGRKVFFVANHKSHLDVFLLISLIPGLHLLAKQSLFRIPLLSTYMYLTQQIPLIRGSLEAFRQSIDTMKGHLNKGHFVLVFPELTRSPYGYKGTLDFRSSVFQAPLETGAVVVPLVIRGTEEIWPKGSRVLFPWRRVEVKMLEPVDAKLFSTSQALCERVHQEINKELR